MVVKRNNKHEDLEIKYHTFLNGTQPVKGLFKVRLSQHDQERDAMANMYTLMFPMLNQTRKYPFSLWTADSCSVFGPLDGASLVSDTHIQTR